MSLYSFSYIFPSFVYLFSFIYLKDFFNLKKEDKWNLFFIGIFAPIFGGRVGYVLLYDISYYINNPIDIFKIWYGGMSFYGSIIFISIFLYVYSKKFTKDFYSLTSLLAFFSCIGIFIGRISSFLNAELNGIRYDGALSVIILIDGKMQSRFPSQLLEALLEGVVLFLILSYLIKKRKTHKEITIAFLFFYSIFRIIVEFFREPDIHIGYIYSFLTLGMIFSFLTLLVSILLFVKR